MPDDPTTPAVDSTLPTLAPGARPAALQAAPGSDFDSRFRTQSELARGGMGRVLVAQDAVLRREVVVKEMLHKENAAAVLRFEREALLTARLQHPGIVSVYELARRASGEPVLVMRRVQGRAFEEAIAGAASLEQRLALLAPFTSACDAVAYAHQQGVIHRDLKPANVLLGAFGDTVVIDWGLAKDLTAAPAEEEQAAAAETLPPGLAQELTVAGSVMGTPAYMAPEQARGEPAGAASDVYALGAMLYHLASGRRPFRGDGSREVLAAVRRGPPEPLAAIVPGLAPELIAIVDRAMAREPQDRYATAHELAEELKRFQAGRLVLAHSYSTRELVWRWARRHAALLAACGVFALVLAAGGALAVRRVVAERDRANREAQVARRVSEFMTGMFQLSDPGEARGNSVTVREVLDKAAKEIEGGLAQDPLIEAQLLDSIGRVYWALGLSRKAQPLLERAVATRRRLLGAEDPDTLRSMSALANCLHGLGLFAGAEAITRESLAAWRRTAGPDHPETLSSMSNLASILGEEGRFAEAEKLQREVLEARRRVLGPTHPQTFKSMNNLASELTELGRLPEALQLYQAALDGERSALGPEHPDTLLAMNNLASTLDDLGRRAEGEKLHREVLQARVHVLGAEHPDTLEALNGLATNLQGQRRFAEAEKLQREVIEVRRRVLGPEHPDTLNSMHNLADTLGSLQRTAEAEKAFREVLEVRRRVLGPEHPDTLVTGASLAAIVGREGRFAEARKGLEAVLAVQQRLGSADAAGTLCSLAGLALLEHDRAGALARLAEAVAGTPSSDLATKLAESDDLAPLRGDPAFAALLEKARASAGMAKAKDP